MFFKMIKAEVAKQLTDAYFQGSRKRELERISKVIKVAAAEGECYVSALVYYPDTTIPELEKAGYTVDSGSGNTKFHDISW